MKSLFVSLQDANCCSLIALPDSTVTTESFSSSEFRAANIREKGVGSCCWDEVRKFKNGLPVVLI